jgi:RsiW-degrading membrane proteinase PrsW (M82 family)
MAAVLAATVVVLTTAGSLASAFLSGDFLLIFLFGLPALALAIAGSIFAARALTGATHRKDLVRAVVLMGSGFVFWLLVSESALIFADAPAGAVFIFALACLPTTGFGLWVLRRLDRNEKEPWRLMLVAVIWGAVVATTLALWGNTLWKLLISDNFPPGPAVNQSLGFSAGILEETSKGIAVLLLYLAMRNEFDDVVDGIIYGAAVGLGFNYMETITYMSRTYALIQSQGVSSAAAPAGAFFQLFIRQGLALFTGHATYTALVGAGLGIARQMPRLHQRLLAIGAGFAAAIAGHMVFDAWIANGNPRDPAAALFLLVLREVVGGGVFTAVVLVLLAMGLSAEGKALAQHLSAEATTGRGAVWPAEVQLLIKPGRRFSERFHTFTRYGFRAWQAVTRLRNAQLDLGMERWHRARQEIDEPLEAEEVLRQRVLDLRSAVNRLIPPP